MNDPDYSDPLRMRIEALERQLDAMEMREITMRDTMQHQAKLLEAVSANLQASAAAQLQLTTEYNRILREVVGLKTDF